MIMGMQCDGGTGDLEERLNGCMCGIQSLP